MTTMRDEPPCGRVKCASLKHPLVPCWLCLRTHTHTHRQLPVLELLCRATAPHVHSPLMAAASRRKKKGGDAAEEEVPEMAPPEVLAADMPLADQKKVFDMTAFALSKEKVEKDQATYIKKELEREFDGMWHCIIGACYGVSITNETKSMLFFKTGLHYVLVFRTLDEERQALDNAPAAAEAEDEDEEDFDGEATESAAASAE